MVDSITTPSGDTNFTLTAETNDLSQYLQLQFSSDVTVVDVASAGAEDGHVTSYLVMYSSDGTEWMHVRNSDSRFVGTFQLSFKYMCTGT